MADYIIIAASSPANPCSGAPSASMDVYDPVSNRHGKTRQDQAIVWTSDDEYERDEIPAAEISIAPTSALNELAWHRR